MGQDSKNLNDHPTLGRLGRLRPALTKRSGWRAVAEFFLPGVWAIKLARVQCSVQQEFSHRANAAPVGFGQALNLELRLACQEPDA
jgi:hypothetical protein